MSSDEERSERRLLAAPLSVRVFEIVWVVPAVNVIVCGAVKVRLLKVELPETACVAPLSTTAPSPVTAPPPDQLPDTLRLYEPRPSVPAVRVRLVAVAAPAKATVLPEALTVNVE